MSAKSRDKKALTVYLEPVQDKWLRRRKAKLHVSVADLIRGAINKLMREDPEHAEFLREWLGTP
jgi:hypothetical protein